MGTLDSKPGLSIIIVTYRRLDALYANLEALLRQDLGKLPTEIIVVNNDPQTVLRPSRWNKLGRLCNIVLTQFACSKVIGFKHANLPPHQ